MEVGFRYKSDEYTGDKPCKFVAHCSGTEIDNWHARAGQWLKLLSSRVNGDPSRRALFDNLVSRLIQADRLPEGETTLFGGRENKQKVLAFVTIAMQAAELANAWGPPVVIGPDGDIAYDWGGFRPELPVKDGPDGLIPGLDPNKLHPSGTWPGVGDMFSGFGKWAGILLALFALSQITGAISNINSIFGGRRR